jgi:AI-2 transport protein TqsA
MEQSLAAIVLTAPADIPPDVKPRISRRIVDAAIITTSLVIVIAAIYLAQSVLLPILLSIFIAILAAAPLRWLKKRHIPPGISVTLVVLGIVLIISAFLFLIAISVRSITDAIPEYQNRFQGQLAQVKVMLEGHGVHGTDKLFQNLITPEAAAGFTVGFLSSVASAFSSIVLILLTVIFILLEASSFPIKLRAAIGDPHAAFPKFTVFANDIKRVVIIQTLISLSTGILMGIWLAILGVDFTIMLGLLTFLFNFVPNIGSIIAAVPAIALTFIQFGIGRALLAGLGFIAVGTLVGNVLQPRLMGQNLGLSSLVVFLSVIIWGSLLGAVGMMLCVPFTLAVKFALESSPRTKWIALLLERVPAPAKSPDPAGKG